MTFEIRKQKLEADGISSSSDVFHFNRFPHLSPGNHPTMTSDQLIDEQCPGRKAVAERNAAMHQDAQREQPVGVGTYPFGRSR